jgi:hypothetical protein
VKGRCSYQPAGRFGNSEELTRVFVRRVHELIAVGYARLCVREHTDAEEEAITGCLVEAIEAVLDDPTGPEWFCYYHVREESRISAPDRKGKRRLRLDIRIDSSEQRPRAHFPFEAKRLGKKLSAGRYLGCDGLGCFVSGNYGREGRLGGMLGYVQSGSLAGWAVKIETAMRKNAKAFHGRVLSPWRREGIVEGLDHTYRSGHDRPSVGITIEIYHTLLAFC